MSRLVQDYFTPAQVIRGIRRRRRAGEVISFEAVRVGSRDGCTLINSAIKFFGGWRQAVEAAGYSYASAMGYRLTYPTKRDVIEAIRLRRERGWRLNARSLLRGEHADSALLYASAKLFGGWSNALESAGFPLRRTIPDMDKYRSRADVLAGIAERKRQRLPLDSHSLSSGVTRNVPLSAAARRYFGSWRNALKAAGMYRKAK